MLAAAVALAFDMTSVMMVMYPGRERVEVDSGDGETVVYACKPGPQGESPQEQAAKAQKAFLENVNGITNVIVADVMAKSDESEPSIQDAYRMGSKMQSWAAANFAYLEKTYGCALLG
jgi:hypothetical protein